MSLIPIRADRPAVIEKDGWTHYISVHDAQYMEAKRAWKRTLAQHHPDGGGTDYAFRTRYERYTAWREKEAAYYAQFNLLPPDGYVGLNVQLEEKLIAPVRQLTGQWNRGNPKRRKPACGR